MKQKDTLRKLLDFDEPGKTGAKPETLGMWNVLWVQQGQSFGMLTLPESARSSLHNALESEVGAVLGGRRGRALPQAIEKQLGELITRATNRPRGTYRESIERVRTVRQELDGLCARRQEMSQTLNDLEVAQETLKRLSTGDRDNADQAELDETRQRHGQLAKLEARIEAARTELKLREGTLEQAEQAVNTRLKLKADMQTEKTGLQADKIHLDGIRDQKKKAQSRVNTLRDGIRQSETAVTEADESVSRCRRTLAIAERQAHIRNLEQRHVQAKSAEKSQREAQQAAAAIRVTGTVIKSIRKASQKLETVQSRLEASATHISFDMTADSLLGIEADGKPLDIEQPFIQAVEPVTIAIPDRGRITVEPAIKNRDKLLREHHDARASLQEALQVAGTKSVADAEDQYTQRQRYLQNLELARQGVQLHAPATDEYAAGAQALADHIETLRQALEGEMKELNLQELPEQQEAETKLRTSQNRADEARGALEAARAALSGPENSLNELQTEISTLQGRYDVRKEQLRKLEDEIAQAEEDRSEDILRSAILEAHTAQSEQETAIAGLEEQRSDETLPQLDARIDRLEKALQGKA